MTGLPADGVLRVRGLERTATAATLLATGQPLEFDQHQHGLSQGLLRIRLPAGGAMDPLLTVVKVEIG